MEKNPGLGPGQPRSAVGGEWWELLFEFFVFPVCHLEPGVTLLEAIFDHFDLPSDFFLVEFLLRHDCVLRMRDAIESNNRLLLWMPSFKRRGQGGDFQLAENTTLTPQLTIEASTAMIGRQQVYEVAIVGIIAAGSFWSWLRVSGARGSCCCPGTERNP